MLEALKTVSLLADGEDPDDNGYGVGAPVPGELATSFSEFKVHRGRRIAIVLLILVWYM